MRHSSGTCCVIIRNANGVQLQSFRLINYQSARSNRSFRGLPMKSRSNRRVEQFPKRILSRI